MLEQITWDAEHLTVRQVERAVRERTDRRIRDLHVRLCGDELIVSGRAPTYYLKQLATHAALSRCRNPPSGVIAWTGWNLRNEISVE